MTARRAAIIALVVLLVAALAGVRTSLGVLYDETVYSGRAGVGWEDSPMLREMALRQVLYSIGPALTLLAAASAFALAVIGARTIAERWIERDVHDARAGFGTLADRSERSADDERARLDVEVGRHD